MKDITFKNLFKLCVMPFFVYMLGYSLDIQGIYDSVPWTNRLVHFLGGLSMAIIGFAVLQFIKKYKVIKTTHKFTDWILLLFFVMSITVFWEFYEFLSDIFLYTRSQPGVDDTMKDMFMGMMGAVVFGLAWFMFNFLKKNKTLK